MDVLYRLQLEAVGRARAEEAALLGDLVRALRPALPALMSPLLLLDVRAPSRPGLVHLQAFLLFGERPALGAAAESPARTEGLFLLDDATFLRVRFTGASAHTEAGRLAYSADRLEGLPQRCVLRDHSVSEVADELARGMAAQTARRRGHLAEAQAHIERLRSLRALLAR